MIENRCVWKKKMKKKKEKKEKKINKEGKELMLLKKKLIPKSLKLSYLK